MLKFWNNYYGWFILAIVIARVMWKIFSSDKDTEDDSKATGQPVPKKNWRKTAKDWVWTTAKSLEAREWAFLPLLILANLFAWHYWPNLYKWLASHLWFWMWQLVPIASYFFFREKEKGKKDVGKIHPMVYLVYAVLALATLTSIWNEVLSKRLAGSPSANSMEAPRTVQANSVSAPHVPIEKEVIAPFGKDESGKDKWSKPVHLFWPTSHSVDRGHVSVRTSDGKVHPSTESLDGYPTSSFEYQSETGEDVVVHVLQ